MSGISKRASVSLDTPCSESLQSSFYFFSRWENSIMPAVKHKSIIENSSFQEL